MYLGKSVCTSARDEGLCRMESHVKNALVKFLAVRRDFLYARLVVHVP